MNTAKVALGVFLGILGVITFLWGVYEFGVEGAIAATVIIVLVVLLLIVKIGRSMKNRKPLSPLKRKVSDFIMWSAIAAFCGMAIVEVIWQIYHLN